MNDVIIPIENWGKDHWSVFAYVETLAVENKGFAIPDARRMRANHSTHPFLGNEDDGSMFPTRLKNGELFGHDDWDCLDNCVNESLLKDIGTGINRAYELTELGKLVAGQLRTHKMNGGVFHTFVVDLKKN